jgi:hypothetical protein
MNLGMRNWIGITSIGCIFSLSSYTFFFEESPLTHFIEPSMHSYKDRSGLHIQLELIESDMHGVTKLILCALETSQKLV